MYLANAGAYNQGTFNANVSINNMGSNVNLPQLSGTFWQIYPNGSTLTLSNPVTPSGGGGTISRLLNLPWFVKI